MRLIDRLSQPQKIVVAIALGLAFGAAGIYLISLGTTTRFGWFAYAPLSGSAYPPGTGLNGWQCLLIWLALIASWALISVRVLRSSSGKSSR
jgi:heme/copper-type cytochrome/quinol oxidase subunit 1